MLRRASNGSKRPRQCEPMSWKADKLERMKLCTDCAEEGRRVHAHGRCTRCLQRAYKSGAVVSRPTPKTGTAKMSNGYMRVRDPGHPLANSDGYVLEHRRVAWEHYGPFPRRVHVHHRNHDKMDNRPENLEVLAVGDHPRLHAVEDGVINQYGEWTVHSPVCSIENCNRPTQTREFCIVHYSRWARTGDPLGVRRVTRLTVAPYVLV
jgi:hypothetical protein